MITLSPEPYDRRIDGFLFRALRALHRHDGTAWITYSFVEGAANVAMFLPVGMFLVLLLGRSRWWLAIAIGVGLSALIETAQMFLPTRVSDVRDLLHNGLGALLAEPHLPGLVADVRGRAGQGGGALRGAQLLRERPEERRRSRPVPELGAVGQEADVPTGQRDHGRRAGDARADDDGADRGKPRLRCSGER